MSIIQAVVLGLVQGLTEFIPISSTAHLEIVPVLLGWGDPGAAASAVFPFGEWVAALIFFWGDIVAVTRGFFCGCGTRRPPDHTVSSAAALGVSGPFPLSNFGV